MAAGRKEPSREVFQVSVKDIREHPAHQGIPDLAEEGFLSLGKRVRLNGVMEPVEILSEKDAEARGEKKDGSAPVHLRRRRGIRFGTDTRRSEAQADRTADCPAGLAARAGPWAAQVGSGAHTGLAGQVSPIADSLREDGGDS